MVPEISRFQVQCKASARLPAPYKLLGQITLTARVSEWWDACSFASRRKSVADIIRTYLYIFHFFPEALRDARENQ